MARRLIAGIDYPESRPALREWYSTQQQCRDALFDIRYPQGWACPHCGAAEYWWRGPTVLRCLHCQHEHSLLADTIFEKTRTPLPVWFEAAWSVATSKTGISAKELQRDMGLGSYETAWMMLHRFRRAMVFADRSKLSGYVEMDETLLGGVEQGGKRGRGTKKVIIVVAVELIKQRTPGRIRLGIVERANGANLTQFIRDTVEPGSTIITDGWQAYRAMTRYGYTHEPHTILGSGQAAHQELPNVHRVASLLKRWLMGTHQGRASRRHLQPYLDEFAFRFNRRRGAKPGLLFHRLLEGAVAHGPAPYEDIKGGP